MEFSDFCVCAFYTMQQEIHKSHCANALVNLTVQDRVLRSPCVFIPHCVVRTTCSCKSPLANFTGQYGVTLHQHLISFIMCSSLTSILSMLLRAPTHTYSHTNMEFVDLCTVQFNAHDLSSCGIKNKQRKKNIFSVVYINLTKCYIPKKCS